MIIAMKDTKMRAELNTLVEQIRNSLFLIGQRTHIDAAKKKLSDIEHRVSQPDIWNNPAQAEQLMRTRQTLIAAVEVYQNIEQELNEIIDLMQLGEAENDTDIIAETEQALKNLVALAEQKEIDALLSEEADSKDALIEINSGAGGTESCDWAAMLVRMYLRWAEKRGYKIDFQSETPGEEAGIKSATYRISGKNAYGWLKSESGVHRLVRISPFDSAARRHTSFSSVGVYPIIDDTIDIDIPTADVRIDTYRASGSGGQHVNTTDSAVRITHLPTGIVVTSSEKSQHQNRANAMTALKARLYQRALEKRNAETREAHQAKGDAGWGNQIRSYVLHPYQMIKDLRTNYETGNVNSVLDGELDKFMAATLALDLAGKKRGEHNVPVQATP